MTTDYLMPPTMNNESGLPRAAGFEFELGNLPVRETAKALQGALGGDITVLSPFEVELEGSRLGRLKIERDAELLKSGKYRNWLVDLGVNFEPGSLAHDIEVNLDNATRNLVPCEVVTAPIELSQLEDLGELTLALSDLGAEGTQDSVVYALGMHINIGIVSDSGESLLRYLQSFLLLQAWFLEYSNIDTTRRFFTNYIAPFPAAYMKLILDVDYSPSRVRLINDYLKHNPTRNRPLDMLPIFVELLPEAVKTSIKRDEQDLVKGRPAFHYRLPDCRINSPGWTPAHAWNQWVYIERLASDPVLLNELMDAWVLHQQNFSITPNHSWAAQLTTLLSQKFLSSGQ